MKFRAKIEKIWRVWAKALGDKSGRSDKEADTVAMIRTFIFLQLVITNCFIVAGQTYCKDATRDMPDVGSSVL